MEFRKKTTAILIALFMISTLAFANASESSVVFGGKKSYLAGYSIGNGYDGSDCVHLQTTTETLGDGSEARVAIKMPEGTVLDDIDLISWMQNIVTGPSVHVDIMVDTTGDDEIDDALVVQYAYNDYGPDLHYPDNPWYYGVMTGAWYATFSDDGDGPAVIDDDAMAWAATGKSGAPPTTDGFFFHSLADWKLGQSYDPGSGSKHIDGDTPVLELQFEVDSWVPEVPPIGDPGVNADAYIDDVTINNLLYNFDSEGPIDLDLIVEPLVMSFTVTGTANFGSNKPGTSTTAGPLTISNTGDYTIDITAELTADTDGFYASYMTMGPTGGPFDLVADWSLEGVLNEGLYTVDLKLAIPSTCIPGIYDGLLVFWATPVAP